MMWGWRILVILVSGCSIGRIICKSEDPVFLLFSSSVPSSPFSWAFARYMIVHENGLTIAQSRPDTDRVRVRIMLKSVQPNSLPHLLIVSPAVFCIDCQGSRSFRPSLPRVWPITKQLVPWREADSRVSSRTAVGGGLETPRRVPGPRKMPREYLVSQSVLDIADDQDADLILWMPDDSSRFRLP
jgi:hypothetical protein